MARQECTVRQHGGRCHACGRSDEADLHRVANGRVSSQVYNAVGARTRILLRRYKTKIAEDNTENQK